MKKIFALVLALMLVLGMTSAMAATITINRDSSWQASTEEDRKATYTWYRIFDANLDDANHPVYTLSGTDAAAKVAVLPSIFTANLAADGIYYITLAANTPDATVFTALATLVSEHSDLFPGTDVTSATNPVALDVGTPDGYFFIKASNGKDVVVDTTGTKEVTEKNGYPTINKEQKTLANPNYTEAEIPAEIGTYIDYQVTVHVPTDATKAIKVFDTMSAGLQYDATTGLTVTPNTADYTNLPSTDSEYDEHATWQIVFSDEEVIAHRGQDIVITYRALITENALTDTGRKNEVKLSYDNGNYILSDEVDYTTYFTGIEKIDGSDSDVKLENVHFTLTSGGTSATAVGNAFNVTPVYDTTDTNKVLYYIPGGSSNEVITGADGKIIIRGLDNTKEKYYLTETENENDGYNLLATPKELRLVEDEGTATTTEVYDQIENNKGSVLPSTGGIGTTLFYVAGSILVLAAVIFLVTKRRMNANND